MMLEREVEWCLGYLTLHFERYYFCAGITMCSVMQAAHTKLFSIVVLYMTFEIYVHLLLVEI
jgi:hypothetical protein